MQWLKRFSINLPEAPACRMKILRQGFIILAVNWIVLFLILELNSLLSPLGLYLVVGGLFVVYPAFHMNPLGGLAVALLTGALWDAVTPAPFGLHLFLLGGLFAGLYRLRHRLRSRRAFHQAVVACGANFLIVLFLTIWFVPAAHLLDYSSRFLIELVFSEVLVFVLSLWMFPLQERCVLLIGAQPTPEEIN